MRELSCLLFLHRPIATPLTLLVLCLGWVVQQMYQKIPPLCWLPYISYVRYALEALYVGEVVNYQSIVELQGVDLANNVWDTFGYELDAYPRDVATVFAFGLAFRLITVAAMVLKDRDKKR